MLEPIRRPASQILRSYGMSEVGRFFLRDGAFLIEITDSAAVGLPESIYVFVIDDEIVRIGCSSALLEDRFRRWQRSVTGALRGLRTETPTWEAAEWNQRLEAFGEGRVYARQAHEIESPIGGFRALLDEERILITRHRPPMNRSNR